MIHYTSIVSTARSVRDGKVSGSFYFTYWQYGGNQSQTPTAVDQGLLVPNGIVDILHHGN